MFNVFAGSDGKFYVHGYSFENYVDAMAQCIYLNGMAARQGFYLVGGSNV